MILEPERRDVAAWAKRLRAAGLVVLTSGNVSARRDDLVAITPTAFDYDRLSPGLVAVVDRDGAVVEGDAPPSSEVPMHLAAYAAVPTAAGVVHTHSPYATALATTVDELPAVHYLIAELGGPVRVVPYATFGTQELADHVRAGLDDRSAVLLASHGALTVGASVEQAFERAVLLEWLAALVFRARLIGEPRLLPPDELVRVAARLPH
jgi:L-fuculose-phosphate aldolase